MNLRPFQQEAVDKTLKAIEPDGHQSALIVMPTGTGKTIVFAHLIKLWLARLDGSRGLVLAHRQELIRQAADKIRKATLLSCDVEMGKEWSHTKDTGLYTLANVVVSTVQTQCTGRMQRFTPRDFGIVIVDEAHHTPSTTYRTVLDHYNGNPQQKIVGVTATPDRLDEAALGQVYDSVPFVYEINDAINDGWLVPIRQRSVFINGLDFSKVKTTAGDLNGKDLARLMEYEENLHGVATPTIELTGDRKTLVFASSIAHAERLSEIFNRHKPNCARVVTSRTPDDERQQSLKDFEFGEYQYLVNVGIATEGYDCPPIECVVIARPTESRALYAQMCGRGTRTLTGLVDGLDDVQLRRDAIASCTKPFLEVIDFSGSSGKHKLITTADILGGNYTDDVIDRANQNMIDRGAGPPEDMIDELANAQRQLRIELDEEQRRKVTASVSYTHEIVNPFDVLDIMPDRERGYDKGKQVTPRMHAVLENAGVIGNGKGQVREENLTYGMASQLIGTVRGRREAGQCTFKQAKLLRRYGYPAGSTFTEASVIITKLVRNNWRPLPGGPQRRKESA